jgi:hypothetical protein
MNKSKLRLIAKQWLHNHPKLYFLYKQGIFKVLTAKSRVLPDFLIIGAAKCGTTSLYDYVIQHPDIYPALRKETKFFDVDYKMGITRYRSNFPLNFSKFLIEKIQKKKFLTGEATPGYLHNYHSANRVHKELPNIKLIVILRNPIDRAFSDYQMRVRAKHENRTFLDVIKYEENLLADGVDLLKHEKYFEYGAKFRPYLSWGRYFDELEPWLKLFPKNNFLFLKTQDLNDDPITTLNHLFEFLDLKPFKIKNLKRQNVGKYEKLDEKIRDHLIHHFKNHNKKLEKFLGINFNWDN